MALKKWHHHMPRNILSVEACIKISCLSDSCAHNIFFIYFQVQSLETNDLRQAVPGTEPLCIRMVFILPNKLFVISLFKIKTSVM